MAIQPFPRFAPDQSAFNPGASQVIKNCKPTKDGWGPMRDLVPISEALESDPRGAFATKSDAGVWYVFAGTATDLWIMDTSNYTWTNASRAVADYNLGDGFVWEFERYGNYVVATAKGSDFPQYIELDFVGPSTFANIPNANFEAELVATVGDFLVFARIDGDNRLVRWSGINDLAFWTANENGSDSQQLPDGGDIQRLLPQNKNSYVIQEQRIRQMVFDSSMATAFRFVVINPEAGAFASRSIINIGPDDFVYLALDGFYRGVAASPIGAERVDSWFFDQVSPDKIDLVSGTKDPFSKVVWWRFETTSGENWLLGYDWQLDAWFYSDAIDARELLTAATLAISIDDFDALGYDIDTIPYSLDSRAWAGGILAFAGFNEDFRFGFFDGNFLEATIDTEEKMLNYPRRAIGDRVRILANTNMWTVAVMTKETQDDSEVWSDDISPEDGTNFATIDDYSGYFHRFRVKISADAIWKNAVGIDVSFTDGGMW